MKAISLKAVHLFFIVFLISPFFAQSQFYSGGQDPASQKWNQINSVNFQVIYPRGYDSIAQYVMNVMEYGRDLTIKSKDIEARKISIILHNQTIVSNAEVAWAPSRMEFYTVTPQSTYAQPWYEQLALHEYTHVLQISSMNQGFTKFLTNLFGEQVTIAVFGMYVPFWFIEGDAVVNETAFSKSGRGRDPNFEAEVRAQIVEIGAYSLEKASLGSYKDYTPDRYHIGYYLVGQGRIDFGKKMWNKPLRNSGRTPLGIVPFSTGIQTETGMGKKNFYKESLLTLRNKWVQQLVKTSPKEYQKVTNSKSYTNYTNSGFISDNEIFSFKRDYHDIGRFVIMDTLGNESTIHTPGYLFDDYISIAGDWLYWSERQYDPRWAYRSFVKIIMLNIKTKEKRTLISKTRYFSANISPSGTKIVAVEVDEFSKHYLVILDAQDGHILQRISSPDNDFIAHPAWSPKEDKVVVELLGSYGKGLAIFDLESAHVQNILPFGYTHIQFPTFWDKYVLFEAAYSGVMDLYALDLSTKSIYQTTQTTYSESDYSVSPNGEKLIFSSYSALGKQMVIADWNPKDWISISNVENHAYPLADMLSKQEDTILNPYFIPKKEYEIQKYSKFAHAFNIHSWNFIHLDANNGGINPGISVLSQNKLSTLQARLGADFNFNTESWRYYGSVDYLGWYPVLSIGADYGKRYIDEIREIDTLRHFYHETNMNAAIYVPLLYTSGAWSFRVQPSVGFNYKRLDNALNDNSFDHSNDLTFDYPEIKAFNYGFSTSAQMRTPSQNLFPTLAYSLNIVFRNTPLQGDLGEMFNIGLATYYPGIFRHDGFRVLANYQDKFGDAAFYSDYTVPARGYTGLSYNELLTINVDYKVPIFYPDWNLSSLIYFKRFIFGVFGDYSMQSDAIQNTSYPDHYFWSAGAELSTDVHFLRTKAPFNLGIRAIYVDGYIKNPQAIVYEFVYGISI